jgi:hypothetical protein
LLVFSLTGVWIFSGFILRSIFSIEKQKKN